MPSLLPALDRLLNRRPAHRILWGLERTTAMLHSLGDPHRAFDSIHVGGTNGKGSTAALIESALRHGGRSTGLYTSPHLCEFAERIRIRGVPAESILLEDCAKDVLVAADIEDASFFEATTVLAFEAFRRSGCEAVVAEVGLGGRLDATNVLEPAVSVISSVDRDHANYLGDTLEAIAAEKAGILKPGVPAVVGRMDPGALGSWPPGPLSSARRWTCSDGTCPWTRCPRIWAELASGITPTAGRTAFRCVSR